MRGDLYNNIGSFFCCIANAFLTVPDCYLSVGQLNIGHDDELLMIKSWAWSHSGKDFFDVFPTLD
jgi:hypothetical protein